MKLGFHAMEPRHKVWLVVIEDTREDSGCSYPYEEWSRTHEDLLLPPDTFIFSDSDISSSAKEKNSCAGDSK